MHRYIHVALFVTGLAAMVLTAALFFQQAWAQSIWPWPLSRLSSIFLASIAAAAGASVLWVSLSGELAALAGGGLNFAVMYFGMAGYTLVLFADDSQPMMLIFGVAAFFPGLLCLAIFLWARRIPFRDLRRTPKPVRLSFMLFVVILLLVGGALVRKTPGVIPWPLSDEASVMYGWIFLGAACYFVYAFVNPSWANARGQLAGFLAYDLVLIVPCLRHFGTVKPELLLSLTLYTAVIIYSGILAIYYLFFKRAAGFEKEYFV
jgi:hypothetical protein